jgi:hypothetical protein
MVSRREKRSWRVLQGSAVRNLTVPYCEKGMGCFTWRIAVALCHELCNHLSAAAGGHKAPPNIFVWQFYDWIQKPPSMTMD